MLINKSHFNILSLRDARDMGRRQASTESNASDHSDTGSIRYIRKKFVPIEPRSSSVDDSLINQRSISFSKERLN